MTATQTVSEEEPYVFMNKLPSDQTTLSCSSVCSRISPPITIHNIVNHYRTSDTTSSGDMDYQLISVVDQVVREVLAMDTLVEVIMSEPMMINLSFR